MRASLRFTPDGRRVIDAQQKPVAGVWVDAMIVDSPTEAILASDDAAMSGASKKLQIDLGRCLFCIDCAQACPHKSIAYSADYQLAARTRQALVTGGHDTASLQPLDDRLRRLLGRSLK